MTEECAQAFAPIAQQVGSGIILPQPWSRPSHGWVKANVDAFVSTIDGQTTLGRLWVVHDMLARAWDRNHLTDKITTLGRAESRNNMILLNPPATLTALVEDDIDRSPVDLVNLQDWLGVADMVCFNLRDIPGG
ncbi:hypothetical protein V6N12_069563 [Hibiscus sabdariffa]|uniref:Uncharacterized protein n=1 Tax=Hibiscus sabdariffa TaxID=183260 RepID=A0ABR2FEN4_9ROSI